MSARPNSHDGCVISIEPIHRLEQTPQLRIVCVKRRQPFADSLAFPPLCVAKGREAVTIKSRANVARRRVWKGIARQKRECAAIVVQKFPDKMQRPRVISWRSHRGKP